MAVTASLSLTIRAYSFDTQQHQSRTLSTQSNPSSSPSFDTNIFKKRLNSITQTPPSKPPTKKDSISVSNLLKLSDPITPIQEEVEEDTYLGSERWLSSAPKVKSERWVPTPPKVNSPRSIYNAASLAYIGDCIYELYARRHFLYPPLSIEEYNDRVMAVVRCEAQDALLKKLMRGKFLTVEERDLLRWGKNIDSGKTRTTKRAGVAVYNRASSLETLIGYLYLTDTTRLEDLMLKLGFSTGVSSQLIMPKPQNKPQ